MKNTSLEKCEAFELSHPNATYSAPEWGYPAGIGSVRIYRQYNWTPLTPIITQGQEEGNLI